ncbi:MAG: manganese efflux pump MntP family protein [Lachnospiraceae bacterium]|nr:manganese efflux pump MntP family protein [Lachnospiraceae bacterium]
MNESCLFFLHSFLLGTGLAMDAFSVSLADGLHDPRMGRRKTFFIAGLFAGFQFLMPLIGWVCLHTILETFRIFAVWIPRIAPFLLLCLGADMIHEKNSCEDLSPPRTDLRQLLAQGAATSVDALSAGFTLAGCEFPAALSCCLVIAGITFLLCLGGLQLGRRFGTKYSGRASLLGGAILIFLGVRLFMETIL